MVSMRATSGAMVNQYNFTSEQTQEAETVGHIWTNIYDAQCNVNNIIQYGPDIISGNPVEADKCRRYLGEAYLLRAMCHFDQCRCYAQPYNYTADASHLGVPILWKTPGADQNVGRSTVREVYVAVLEDLGHATELLTDGGKGLPLRLAAGRPLHVLTGVPLYGRLGERPEVCPAGHRFAAVGTR